MQLSYITRATHFYKCNGVAYLLIKNTFLPISVTMPNLVVLR